MTTVIFPSCPCGQPGCAIGEPMASIGCVHCESYTHGDWDHDAYIAAHGAPSSNVATPYRPFRLLLQRLSNWHYNRNHVWIGHSYMCRHPFWVWLATKYLHPLPDAGSENS